MAGSGIKGITVEIGGDTTKLQTALKGVNSLLPGMHRLPASTSCRISSNCNPHAWKPSMRPW